MLNKNNLIIPYYTNVNTAGDSSKVKLDTMDASFSIYGKLFNEIAKLTNVPIELLFSIAMVESGGLYMRFGKSPGYIKPDGKYREYLGIMQTSYTYADERLINNRKFYSKEEKIFIANNFGEVGQAIALEDEDKIKIFLKKATTPNQHLFPRSLLAQDKINVFMGAQMLINALNQPYNMEGNKVNIARLIVTYNAGGGRAINSGASKQTPLQILSNTNVPLESRTYIRKLAGNGGYLNLWKLHYSNK